MWNGIFLIPSHKVSLMPVCPVGDHITDVIANKGKIIPELLTHCQVYFKLYFYSCAKNTMQLIVREKSL
jgi:hypothetical protein